MKIYKSKNIIYIIYVFLIFSIYYTKIYVLNQQTIECGIPGEGDPKNPTIECPVQGSDGIISITTGTSCSLVNNNINGDDIQLNCDNSEDKATIMEIGITPGIKSPNEYEFQVLYPKNIENNNAFNSNDCIIEEDPSEDYPHGRCFISNNLKLKIESSNVIVGYNLNLLDLKIPHAYTSHTSDAFGASDDTDNKNKFSKTCEGKPFFISRDKNQKSFRKIPIIGGRILGDVIPNTCFISSNSELCRGICKSPLLPNSCQCKRLDTGIINSGNTFLDYPFVHKMKKTKPGDDQPFDGHFCCHKTDNDDSFCPAAFTTNSCQDMISYCSMCTSFMKDYFGATYFSKADADYFGNKIDDDDENDGDDDEIGACPFYEGRNDRRTSKIFCDIDECNANDHSKRYCTDACSDKFGEYLNERSPGRQWFGSEYDIGRMYKCIDDGGDEDDFDSFGFNIECVQEKFPNYDYDNFENNVDINFYDFFECFEDRPLMYDDCDEDDFRRDAVLGPYRVFEYNKVIPGCSLYNSLIPSIDKSKWPTTTNSNRPDRFFECTDNNQDNCHDSSPCSVDDDECIDSKIYSYDPNSGDVIPVALCPSCGCIPQLQNPFNKSGRSYKVQEEFQCDDSIIFGDDDTSDSIKRICNSQFPLYEDDDDIENDDNMHPSNPFDYETLPLNVCPFNGPDRIGLISTNFYTDPLSLEIAPTAQAIGTLLPYCSAYEIEPKAIPYYNINITLFSEEDDNFPTQTVILSNFQEGSEISSEGISNDNLLYGKIDGIDIITKKLASDLRGLIVICNAGAKDGSYSPPNNFNMGGDFTNNSEFFKNFKNPWETIFNSESNTFNIDNPNFDRDNLIPFKFSDLPGLPPLPQLLNLLNNLPENSWWYYVSPEKRYTYGEGPGQIGLDPIGLNGNIPFYNDITNTENTCKKRKNEDVPGFSDEPYLLQQRWFGSNITGQNPFGSINDNNCNLANKNCKGSPFKGMYEKALVYKKLKVHTPCVVSGMFFDLLKARDCDSFNELLKLQNHLPPNYVSIDNSNSKQRCQIPNYFIQNNKLIYTGSETDTKNLYLRLKIAIPESNLLSVDQYVSTAKFINLNLSNYCSVIKNTNNGGFYFQIQNTGDSKGSYFTEINCNSNIISNTPPESTIVSNLNPGEQSEPVFINIQHQGSIPLNNTALCTLFLHPVSLPEILLDKQQISCSIEKESLNLNFTQVSENTCDLYNVGCSSDDFDENYSFKLRNISSFLILILSIILLILSIIICFGCYRFYNDISFELNLEET